MVPHRLRLAVRTQVLWIICVVAPTPALAQTARTTANQGLPAHYGWTDPSGNNGLNVLSLTSVDDKTVAAASRVYNKLGDPSVDFNLPAYNGNYTVTFKLIAVTPTLGTGQNSTVTALLTTERSTNSGGSAKLAHTYHAMDRWLAEDSTAASCRDAYWMTDSTLFRRWAERSDSLAGF